MSHSKVASVAEPWLLLPFLYATKKEGVLSQYNHMTSSMALSDFIENLPEKENTYHLALKKFADTLYESQCQNGEQYFLDKTPRYYLIINEIIKIFPNAKFIFLFRNPLHIMSSMIETWGGGTLKNMYAFRADLNQGFKLLSLGYQSVSNSVYALRYEDFVMNPELYVSEICDYLDLDFESAMLGSFSKQKTKGKMGDPTGIKQYSTISSESLVKWEKTFSSKYRKEFAAKYINSIDSTLLSIQGYEKTSILQSIEDLPHNFSFSFRDRLHLLYSLTVEFTKANIFFGNTLKKWCRSSYLS